MNPDIPDMGGTSQVERGNGADYLSFLYTTYMIGVDFQSDAIILIGINHEGRGHAAQGFSQHDGSPAMEQPIRLARAVI